MISTVQTKTCTKCEVPKPLSDFYAYKRSPDGKRPRCKECMKSENREWKTNNPERSKALNRRSTRNWIRRQGGNRATHLKAKFGITQTQYDAMLRDQEGVCLICEQPETKQDRTGKVQPLSVDHDHETGVVRGLLCCKCNRMLGSARDNPDILRAAAEYLENAR